MFFTDQSQNLSNQLKTWWGSLPIYSKAICILTITTSILSVLANAFSMLTFMFYFYFDPYFAIERLFIWEFFTYPFLCLDPISAIFSLFSYTAICGKKERNLGTFRFILYFAVQNCVIAVVFIPLYYFLYFLGAPSHSYFLKLFLAGLWPAIMCEMIVGTKENPEEPVPFMCFPVKIKRKLYPWVFFLLFSFIFGVLFHLLAGLAAGYLCNYYLDLYELMNWSSISEESAEKWEKKVCFWNTWVTGFISINEAGQVLPDSSAQQSGPSISGSTPSITPFSGTGHRLGGDRVIPNTIQK